MLNLMPSGTGPRKAGHEKRVQSYYFFANPPSFYHIFIKTSHIFLVFSLKEVHKLLVTTLFHRHQDEAREHQTHAGDTGSAIQFLQVASSP